MRRCGPVSRAGGHGMAGKAASSGRKALKVGLAPVFSAWLYLCEQGPARLNARLVRLAHRLMRDPRNAVSRTNAGGWHYAWDLFELRARVVEEFRAEVESTSRRS